MVLFFFSRGFQTQEEICRNLLYCKRKHDMSWINECKHKGSGPRIWMSFWETSNHQGFKSSMNLLVFPLTEAITASEPTLRQMLGNRGVPWISFWTACSGPLIFVGFASLWFPLCYILYALLAALDFESSCGLCPQRACGIIFPVVAALLLFLLCSPFLFLALLSKAACSRPDCSFVARSKVAILKVAWCWPDQKRSAIVRPCRAWKWNMMIECDIRSGKARYWKWMVSDPLSLCLCWSLHYFCSEVVPILTASFQGTDSVIAKALVKAKDAKGLIRSSWVFHWFPYLLVPWLKCSAVFCRFSSFHFFWDVLFSFAIFETKPSEFKFWSNLCLEGDQHGETWR